MLKQKLIISNRIVSVGYVKKKMKQLILETWRDCLCDSNERVSADAGVKYSV